MIRAFKYHTLRLLMLLFATVMLQSCIKNDVPYPRTQPNFLEFEVHGQAKNAEINTDTRVVTVYLDETVNIKQVEVCKYSMTDGAKLSEGNFDEPIDLTNYYICSLSLYQTYDWVIKGVQEIERYFTVENQVGASIIDVGGRRVKVTVSSSGGGLKNVKVLTMKLGPKDCLTTPALEGQTIDLSSPVEVTIDAFGEKKVWTIIGEETTSNVTTVRADAWTNVAWVYGTGLEAANNGVEYRVSGTQEWIKAPDSWVTKTGGTFNARLINLAAETEYEARAYGDNEYGDVVKFTTGSVEQLPNSSLSNWSQNGAVWQPWGENDTPYWDTGNKGATTLGSSNVVPTTDTSRGSGQAAMLQTKFVGIGVVGKLAAGSVYTGSFVRVDGTNGVLSMGRPFTQRPTAVRGYFKYTTAPINKYSAGFESMVGQPDTCVVWCALLDSSEPFEVRTNPKNQQLFDPDGANVVAYGRMQCAENVPQYKQFTVTFDYVATNRTPKYIIVCASASKYGDYFTGGDGAVMCVDDIELVYDY